MPGRGDAGRARRALGVITRPQAADTDATAVCTEPARIGARLPHNPADLSLSARAVGAHTLPATPVPTGAAILPPSPVTSISDRATDAIRSALSYPTCSAPMTSFMASHPAPGRKPAR